MRAVPRVSAGQQVRSRLLVHLLASFSHSRFASSATMLQNQMNGAGGAVGGGGGKTRGPRDFRVHLAPHE